MAIEFRFSGDALKIHSKIQKKKKNQWQLSYQFIEREREMQAAVDYIVVSYKLDACNNVKSLILGR